MQSAGSDQSFSDDVGPVAEREQHAGPCQCRQTPVTDFVHIDAEVIHRGHRDAKPCTGAVPGLVIDVAIHANKSSSLALLRLLPSHSFRSGCQSIYRKAGAWL